MKSDNTAGELSGLDTRPIFLVGTGRCGSTWIYSLLSMHPDVAWFSSWMTLAPRVPLLAAGNWIWKIPGTHGLRERRFFPKPVEAENLFSHHVERYYTESVSEEVLEEARQGLLPLIARVQRLQARPRFLTKLGGRPIKIELLDRLFPNAYFIHVVRRLKPTVASLLRVDFYEEKLTPDFSDWTWGDLPDRYLDFYESTGRAEEVAAAIKVILNVEETNRQLEAIESSRKMFIAYQDLVADPASVIAGIASHTDLRPDERFIQRIRDRRVIRGTNQKWREYFEEEQIRRLDELEALVGPQLPMGAV